MRTPTPEIPFALAPGLRPAERADVESLSGSLVRAFRNDPLHRWIFPDERTWQRRSPRFWRALLNTRLGHRLVVTTPALEAVAVWGAPRSQAANLRDDFPLLARMAFVLGGSGWRVGRGLSAIGARHPGEPHWYLELLGTDPPHQGRGAATALLTPFLVHCDEERQFAYLEASQPKNVPFYERHGFAVCGAVDLPAGPRVTLMRREPHERAFHP